MCAGHRQPPDGLQGVDLHPAAAASVLVLPDVVGRREGVRVARRARRRRRRHQGQLMPRTAPAQLQARQAVGSGCPTGPAAGPTFARFDNVNASKHA